MVPIWDGATSTAIQVDVNPRRARDTFATAATTVGVGHGARAVTILAPEGIQTSRKSVGKEQSNG
jgi:hypothetical protein